MGIPTVTLVTKPFERAARSAARGQGLAALPIVVLPNDVASEVDAATLESVLAGLTTS